MPLRGAAVAAAKAEMFKALGHPIRVRVLEVLVDGERPVGDIAEDLGVEMSHLSQQLGVLRRAQIVTARRVRSTVFYSVRDPRMSQLLAVARQMLVDGLRDSQALLADLESDQVAGPSGADGAGRAADAQAAPTATSVRA
ncbi:MAG: ArsR/SmtB family transcription factor [Actinomycetes bacterium]